ncbi:hypothetical protein ACNFIA_15055 [Pseudomonas sp. NY15437]|uniref:hypothetical protein n=1 Tax=unclassified Pseudomonas TaxID=196821 RepID=UPI00223C4A27|nr:hypothetical protein [Pseudomonas sp. GCEP-101]
MNDMIDSASLLMKLVIILCVMLMACSVMVLPDKTFAVAPAVLLLIAPMFLLTLLLDLTEGLRRR